MTSTTGTTKSGAITAGIVVLLVGVLAAAGLWFSANQRYNDAVKGLARAPIGCDTTLDFAAGGTFLIFVETRGSMSTIAGDCDADTEYSSTSSTLPDVLLTMLDPEGATVTLGDASGTAYEAAGFTGESIRSVVIQNPGDHVLRVESTSTDVVLAVGRDPGSGVGMLKLGAVLAAIAALIGGGALLVVGSRKRTAPAVAAPVWPVAGSPNWPTAPPGMPQPPPPAGWQPVVGPPSQIPGQPPMFGTQPVPPMPQQPSDPFATQHSRSPQPGPAQPASTPSPGLPQPPSPPATPGSFGDPGSGNSGDGERSPWAPPGGDTH